MKVKREVSLEHIKQYCREGLCVIPCKQRSKEPAVEWKEFQKRMPTEEELTAWFSGTGYNVAVVCGTISGNLVVVDIDNDTKKGKIKNKLFGADIEEKTLVVKTSRGFHIYLRTDYPVSSFRLAGKEISIDVKGEGSYVLAPPSIHPSGVQYTVVSPNFRPQIMTWSGDLKQDLIEKIKMEWEEDLGEEVNINDLLCGVDGGKRNNSAIIIASFYRLRGLSKEEAWEQLKMWNERNRPPLDISELKTVLNSAYNRPEPYKYNFLEGVIEKEFFSRDEVEQAEQLLNRENILEWIEANALGDIVGHKKQKTTLFLLNLVNESVHVHGDTSTGKSYMVDRIFDCFPRHSWFKITGVSDKAIRYLDDNIRHLYLAEWRATGGKQEQESTAAYDIKLTISEGKLSILVVEKIEGKFKTQTITTSIENVISTTTDTQIPPELLNRIWEITTDRALTPDIVSVKGKEITKLPSKRIYVPAEKLRKILRCAVEKIEQEAPKDYVIPFFDELLTIFSYLWHEPRAARDIEKLQRLIYASAYLHYKNRPIVEDEGKSVLVCLPIDFVYAWEYGDEAIVGTFTGETKRYKEIKDKVRALAQAGLPITGETLAKIANTSVVNANRWLRRMENEKVVELKTREGAKKIYELTEGKTDIVNISLDLEAMYKKTMDFLTVQKFIQKCEIKSFETKILNVRLPLHFCTAIEDLKKETEEQEWEYK